jgi:hypothetical protein
MLQHEAERADRDRLAERCNFGHGPRVRSDALEHQTTEQRG